MESRPTVTAVVLGHGNREQLDQTLKDIEAQTVKPTEVIVCACCMDISDVESDIRLTDDHKNDVGQRFCDWGLRLSNSDYTFFASCDDYYDPKWIESLLGAIEDTDQYPELILGAFHSHLVGAITNSSPNMGSVTRGSFLVRTDVGRNIGYTGRDYNSDGDFVVRVAQSGSWVNTQEIHYWHK